MTLDDPGPIGRCLFCGQVVYECLIEHCSKCEEYGKRITVQRLPNSLSTTPESLLQRAQGILQAIADSACIDDNRERVAELREREILNIERWLQDYLTME